MRQRRPLYCLTVTLTPTPLPPRPPLSISLPDPPPSLSLSLSLSLSVASSLLPAFSISPYLIFYHLYFCSHCAFVFQSMLVYFLWTPFPPSVYCLSMCISLSPSPLSLSPLPSLLTGSPSLPPLSSAENRPSSRPKIGDSRTLVTSS